MPVSMPFPLPFSMYGAIEDALRLSWAVRKKPLESFLLPAAAFSLPGGAGVMACRDGSLVSLFRLDGARSMMGARELDGFIELGARRLNSVFTGPGHALHAVFERAPDEAARLVAAAGGQTLRQCERIGLALGDVIAERGRRLAPLMAAESFVIAAWTRPAVLPPDQVKRDSKQLRRRLRQWLPDADSSQCPYLAPDGLPPRHEAFLDTLAALFAEAGIMAEVLGDAAACASLRRLLNGSDSTAPDWRPVTVANDAPARLTAPPEDGAFPPPLGPQLLIRDPERTGGGIRIGERLYGALDMALGPRRARPFSELMERLADAGLPCRFSVLIEGGGLTGLDAAMTNVAAAFLAFSSDDSLLVRNAMRDLSALGADAHAIVRLRLGLLTWVTPEDGEDALRRRLSRLQQLAEGWGETVFTPLVGDPLESLAASVPGFCCGATAEPALAPLTEALRLLPAGRPAPLSNSGTGHLFRSIDGKPLPFAWEDGEDYGFELIYGVPGRGKSVLMNSLGLAFSLQGGQARLPLSATIDIGPSSAGLISLIREALPPERRHEAGWFALRMTAEHAINPCDTQLGCRAPLPAERAFLVNLLGLMMTPGWRGRRPRRHARADRPGDHGGLCAALRQDRRRRAACLHRRPRRGGRCGAGRRRDRSARGPVVVGDRRPVVRGRRPRRGRAGAALRRAGAGRSACGGARARRAGARRRYRLRCRQRNSDPGLYPHPDRACPATGRSCSRLPPSISSMCVSPPSIWPTWLPRARPRRPVKLLLSTCWPAMR